MYILPENKFYHDNLNQTRQNYKTEESQRQTSSEFNRQTVTQQGPHYQQSCTTNNRSLTVTIMMMMMVVVCVIRGRLPMSDRWTSYVISWSRPSRAARVTVALMNLRPTCSTPLTFWNGRVLRWSLLPRRERWDIAACQSLITFTQMH